MRLHDDPADDFRALLIFKQPTCHANASPMPIAGLTWAARQQRAEAREREEGGGPSRLLERGVARLEQLFDTTGIRGNYVNV